MRRDFEEAAQNRQTSVRCELPIQSQGAGGIVELRQRFHYDEDGRVLEVFGVLRDIPERRRAEEALHESEATYRALVERANDGIAIIQDGILTYANARLAAILDNPLEKILGTPFVDHLHPEDVAALSERYRRRLAGEGVPSIYEVSLRRRDGRRVPVEINASVVTSRGKPAALVIVRDISGRQQEEKRRDAPDRRRERTASPGGVSGRGHPGPRLAHEPRRRPR